VLMPDACERRQHNGTVAFQMYTRGIVKENQVQVFITNRVCALQDHQINEPKWDAWKVLPEAVRTGEVAFALAHGGLDMHEVGPSCLLNTLTMHNPCCRAQPLSTLRPPMPTVSLTGGAIGVQLLRENVLNRLKLR
jgi:hypothetical protein